MRALEPALRVALVFDDERDRRRFVDHLGPQRRVYQIPGGDELLQLGMAGAIDVAVCGVINRTDPLLPSALHHLSLAAPQIAVIGVFEPSPPSLEEAVELLREIPSMSFVSRPGGRFDYLARRIRAGAPARTFSSWLLQSIERVPVGGPAFPFAILQALHPSCAANIPEQARALGLSRRNLERWFQGPDLCSAGCFQSVCGAAEAAYLRLILELPAREVALAVGILTREGVENPQAVPRTIRNALRVGLEELREAGVQGVLDAAEVALRSSRDPARAPVQWEPGMRFVAERDVIAVPADDKVLLVSPGADREYRLDPFGHRAWEALLGGVTFGELVVTLAAQRSDPLPSVRARLIVLLGELLVRRFVRRERGHLKAANGD